MLSIGTLLGNNCRGLQVKALATKSNDPSSFLWTHIMERKILQVVLWLLHTYIHVGTYKEVRGHLKAWVLFFHYVGPSDLTEFIKLGGSPPLFPPLSSSPPFSVLKMCLSGKVRASRVQESGIDPQNYKIKSSLRECTTLPQPTDRDYSIRYH